MKRSNFIWQLSGFAVTSLGGTLLHFLYDMTGKAKWAALISSVNESTFEHMKLLFFPMLIFALIQGLFYKGRRDFFSIKLRGILLGITLIPVLFYTYNGVIGKSPDWINIAIFFISAAISYFYEWRMLRGKEKKNAHPRVALFILAVLALLFMFFTFYPLCIDLFLDPESLTYGIDGKSCTA